MGNIQKLAGLVASLEQSGDEARLYAARAAYNFKHSWLEMATALVEVQKGQMFLEWGYDSFIEYCVGELGLKKPVVDKLTTSITVMQQVAPDRLEGAPGEESIPDYQALDYYARATGMPRMDGEMPRDLPPQDLSPETQDQLYMAVFDEGCTQRQLKERFDPVIRPKTPTQEQRENTKRAMQMTKKMLQMIGDLEGINPQVLDQAMTAMEDLQVEMAQLMDTLNLVEAD